MISASNTPNGCEVVVRGRIDDLIIELAAALEQVAMHARCARNYTNRSEFAAVILPSEVRADAARVRGLIEGTSLERRDAGSD